MNRIKALRLEHDMSQRDLAARVGCSQKSVDYWEKGLSEPTAGFICALADCFSCTTDYLLGREDDFGTVRMEASPDGRFRKLLATAERLDEERRHELEDFALWLAARQ